MTKKNKRVRKAGVVVYRLRPGGAEILLVSARRFPGSWVFPSGTVEKGEKAKEAARRECAEEAGYEVKLGPRLSPFEVVSGQTTSRYKLFLATIAREVLHDESDRDRKWVPLSQLPSIVPGLFQEAACEAQRLIPQVAKQTRDGEDEG
jgi:8-oxo-dGTP pyrophosphatase MutT (NUDIX family)